MKAANSASSGRGSPSTSGRGAGAGARSTTASRSICTPKLVIAEPTNTGVLSPARKLSISTSAPIASRSPQPSRACFQAGPSSIAACSGLTISSGAIDDPRATRVKRTKSPVRRSITPRKSPDWPTGHVTGVGRKPICCSTSSSSSNGSRPGLSYLLKNVITGRFCARHTSNNFKVCGSIPFATSSTMMTASTADSTR